jgi:hypothetical protein
MTYQIETIFKTEGVPEFTFVKPPNYNDILVDIRNPGKPVIIEGQSGTGKTTIAKQIIQTAFPNETFTYLTPRKKADLPIIMKIVDEELNGKFIIDDFHRLDDITQEKIANLVKVAAEDPDPELYPKIVLIGINKVGSELIHLVHDIAKRCGIHKVRAANENIINELIQKGEEKLNININEHHTIFQESEGDYWLTQLLCQTICLNNNVLETLTTEATLQYDLITLRGNVISKLDNTYNEPVKEFCRGRRFRATNDPYFRLLKTISEQSSSVVDLNELANANPDNKGSINNIKEHRINTLLASKPICEQYFYYNSNTKNFAIEDPALFYYMKHLNWEEMRMACGFRNTSNDYQFDFAISFAGENRELAKNIADLLTLLDCTVFYDEYYEANYLGQTWSKQFSDIFGNQARYVICLLDINHSEKIWPTFEREIFIPRVKEESVIPIYLDDTVFADISKDTIGIDYKLGKIADKEMITDKIVYKLEEKLNQSL